LQLLCISALVGVSYFYQSLYIMIGFAFFIHIFSGIMYTSFFATSILFFPKNTGVAGGLMGGLIYLLTSTTSFIISVSGVVNEQRDLAWRYWIICIVLFLVILLLNNALKKQKAVT